MAYNNSPTTAATNVQINATAPKTDLQIQREHLLSRLENLKPRWNDLPDTLREKLRKMFNLNAPTIPAKPQELIDAIKAGKFTLNQKKIDTVAAKQAEYEERAGEDADPNYCWDDYGTLDFITFTDLPKADRNGYEAAVMAYLDASEKTRDTIIVSDPATGLKALYDLENWMPTPAQIAKPN